MAYTKINDKVLTPEGQVTTIHQLDIEGKIEYKEAVNWRGMTGRKAYFADLESGRGWQIGKLAYLSRTGNLCYGCGLKESNHASDYCERCL